MWPYSLRSGALLRLTFQPHYNLFLNVFWMNFRLCLVARIEKICIFYHVCLVGRMERRNDEKCNLYAFTIVLLPKKKKLYSKAKGRIFLLQCLPSPLFLFHFLVGPGERCPTHFPFSTDGKYPIFSHFLSFLLVSYPTKWTLKVME